MKKTRILENEQFVALLWEPSEGFPATELRTRAYSYCISLSNPRFGKQGFQFYCDLVRHFGSTGIVTIFDLLCRTENLRFRHRPN
jgi:hypothetical protein